MYSVLDWPTSDEARGGVLLIAPLPEGDVFMSSP